jgi:catalase
MKELLFENISKTEKSEIVSDIIKEMKKSIEGMVEKEVLKQLKLKNSESNKAVKEIISKSMVNLFRTLFNKSAVWSNSL